MSTNPFQDLERLEADLWQAADNLRANSKLTSSDYFLPVLKWLPHTDSKTHRDQGAWVHVAPAITGDLKKWFESTKWVRPGDWPNVAKLIFDFVTRCNEKPAELDAACRAFAKDPNSKGLQTGMLTPILNALHEDRFLIINNKTRKTLNYFLDADYPQSLAGYPATNAAAMRFAHEEIAPLGQRYPELTALHDGDLFDIFGHWFVGVKKALEEPGEESDEVSDEPESGSEVGYWKIAPGDNAWQWQECRSAGFVAIGWDELGDLTNVTRVEFESRRDALLAKHPAGLDSRSPGASMAICPHQAGRSYCRQSRHKPGGWNRNSDWAVFLCKRCQDGPSTACALG